MLGPSLSIGRLFGMPLKVHWTFSILLLWVLVANLVQGGSMQTATGGMLFLAILFGCVLVHELGHSLAARRYGIGTRHITLSPIGGVAALERMPRRWTQELWIALAGPAVNIAICVLILPFLFVNPVTAEDFTHPFSSISGILAKLFAANLLLAVFNLLPAFPMDGGRVFRALLAARGDRMWATRIAVRTGQVFAAGFALIGLAYSPLLMIIAVFLFFAAEAELESTRIDNELRAWTVGDVMRRTYEVVSPRTAIADAAWISLEAGQRALPVVADGKVVGILDRGCFSTAKSVEKPESWAVEYAISDFAVASEDDSVTFAMELMRKSGQHALPVFREGELIGLLDHSIAADLYELPLAGRKRVSALTPAHA